MIFGAKSCKECGMIFKEPVEEIRTTHHIWRFHKPLYEDGLKKCWEMFGDTYIQHGSFKTLEELRDYSELELINYDMYLEVQQ